jgi:hypothetical protein
MAGNARFHDKVHRKNHHTLPTVGYPDSGLDPIASYSEPFQGDFVLNGLLSARTGVKSLSVYATSGVYCEDMYVRNTTYTNFISGQGTETIISDGALTGYGDNTMTMDYRKAIYAKTPLFNVISELYVNGNATISGVISSNNYIYSKDIWINRGNNDREGGQINFNRSFDNAPAWAIDTYTDNIGSLSSRLRIIDLIAGQERVTILSSGNVGIGVSAPTQKLQVQGNTSVNGNLSALGGDVSLNTGYYLNLATNGSGHTAIKRNGSINGMEFYTSSQPRMFISDTGNVGIGTSTFLHTPTDTLEVSGSIGANAFRVKQGKPDASDASTAGYSFGDDGDTGMFSPSSVGSPANAGLGKVAFYCNNNETARTYYNAYPIFTIGLSAASEDYSRTTLAIGDINNGGIIELKDGNNKYSLIYRDSFTNNLWLNGKSTNSGIMLSAVGTGTVTLATSGNAAALQVQSNGSVIIPKNVGIGTSSPSTNLHVKGVETSPVGGGLGITPLMLNNSATDYPWMRFGVSMYSGDYNPITQTGDQCIIFSGQSTTSNSVSSNLVIAPHSSTSSTGMRMTYDGKVGIGTASPIVKLTVVGDISATGKIYANDFQTKVAADITSNTILDKSYANQIIGVDSSTGITVTVPQDSTSNFDIGTNIVIYQKGSGQVSIGKETSVTILSNSNKVNLTGQNSVATLFKLAANRWLLGGDLTT